MKKKSTYITINKHKLFQFIKNTEIDISEVSFNQKNKRNE